VPDAVDTDWLARAREAVIGHLDEHGKRYFSLVRPGNDRGSPAGELVEDPKVEGLLRGVTQTVCPQGIADYEEVYNVLRIIAGPKGESGSLEFHYDASVVTMLVPLFIPQNAPGESGELVVFPNDRPFRGSVVTNLLEKAVVQNKLYRDRTSARFERDPQRYMRTLKPGNAYLFLGYRTLHGNLPCAPNSLRATMLLHYGNPHGNDPLLKIVRSARERVEHRRLTGA
jgi:hypothetical protein